MDAASLDMTPKKKSTEYVRAFRERQRANRPPKRAPKSASERCREYRRRKKALLNASACVGDVQQSTASQGLHRASVPISSQRSIEMNSNSDVPYSNFVAHERASDGWYRRWMSRWKKADGDFCDDNCQENVIPDPIQDAADRPDINNEDSSGNNDSGVEVSLESLNNLLSPASFLVSDNGIFNECDFIEHLGLADCRSVTAERPENAENLARNKVAKKKGERYLPQFKNKVAAYAMQRSIKEAAFHFKVNKGTVSDWIRDRNKSRGAPTKQEKVAYRPDVEFIDWLRESRERNSDVTRDALLEKLKMVQSCPNESSDKRTFWLFLYAKRLEEGNSNAKNRITYPDNFKREVALHAVKSSNKKTSRIFNIARKRIHEWIQCVDSLGGKVYNRDVSRYVTDDKIDKEIWAWYKSQSTIPTSRQIREKATDLYRNGGFTDINCSAGWYYRWRTRYALPSPMKDKMASDLKLLCWVLGEFDRNKTVSHARLLNQAVKLKGSNFKASSSWAVRFSKRYAPLLQSIPDSCTALPISLEKKIQLFRKQVINAYKEKSLSPKNLVALDEIPLNFISSGTVKRESLLRKSGFENCHASLILSCSSDGHLFPTVLILKSHVDYLNNGQFSDVLTLEQEKGINDENTMQEWMNHVFLPHINSHSILLCDMYKPHVQIKNANESKMEDRKFDIMLIPGGCSSKLQPVLFRLADKFKSTIESHWTQWQFETSWTSGSGTVKFPNNADILKWVAQSHQVIASQEKEMILQSFYDCGFLADTGLQESIDIPMES